MATLPSVPFDPSAKAPEELHDIELQVPTKNSLADEKHLLSTTQLNQQDFSRGNTPVPKYSNRWWKRFWNRAVRLGRLPRILYATVGVCIIVLWVALTFYFANSEVTWNKNQDFVFNQRARQSTTTQQGGAGILLEGALKNFDPIGRTLNIEWSGLWQDYGRPDMVPVPLANGTWPNTPWPVEIYRETAVSVWINAPTYEPADANNNTIESPVVYKIANASTPAIATIGMTEDDSFSTEISFKQASDGGDIMKQPLFAYPYDEWKGSISFVANDPWSDRIYNTTKSWVYPLTGAKLIDNSLNWRFDLEVKDDCTYPANMSYVLQKLGQSEYYTDVESLRGITNQTFETWNVPCQMKIELVGRRPPLVRFAAVLSVIVNWTSTLIIFVLTCEVLIMRRGYMLSGTDLLGITFTSLFALPSVRLLLPGAPDFGALIDLVGIIPNVIIISICIMAIAIAKLNKNKSAEKDD